MITVHIIDDHKMLVEGLQELIKKTENITILGVSHCIKECRAALAIQTPDVLLLDLNLPDGSGIDFCSEVRKKYPNIKILILSTHNEYSVVKRALDNGASGYILKNTLSEEVIAGIEAVMEGETFLCDEIDALMKKQKNQQVRLTKRETEVLQLITAGYSNQETADKLFLSVETIKSYRKILKRKLDAKNSVTLTKITMENQLV